MKKVLIALVGLVFLASCGNDGSTPGQKLDTLLKKVDTTADKFVDSSKSKLEQLKDKVENIHIDIRKDSTKKDTSKH